MTSCGAALRGPATDERSSVEGLVTLEGWPRVWLRVRNQSMTFLALLVDAALPVCSREGGTMSRAGKCPLALLGGSMALAGGASLSTTGFDVRDETLRSERPELKKDVSNLTK